MAGADSPVRRVTIVGGGTAGWMTAAVLSQWLSKVEIKLIESEEIGTIGVGEATIPHIRNLLALAGVDPLKLISESKATFKLGILYGAGTATGPKYDIHGQVPGQTADYTFAAFAQTFRYDTPESQSAQAHAYMALLRVLSVSPWIRGAVWWHWDQVKNAVIDRGFSPRDKAAECVIGHYWGPPSTRVGPPVDTTADACLLNHVAQS